MTVFPAVLSDVKGIRPLRNLMRDIRAQFAGGVPVDLMPAFRRFYAAHIFLQTLKLEWRYPDNPLNLLVQAVMLSAAVSVWSDRFHRFGLLLLLMFKVSSLVGGFPMTGNHLYVESYVLLFLLLYPDRPHRESPELADGKGVHLIQLTVLSIYFYAGAHKLLHGFWTHGEYVGQSLYSESTYGVWYSTQKLLTWISQLFGLPLGELPYEQSAGISRAAVEVPEWTVPVFLLLGWLTIATELLVPILAVLPRTRKLGVPLMVLLTIAIGTFSWEMEFMFGATACALLFYYKHPKRIFYTWMAIHVAWSLFVILADIRVWVL